MNLSAVLDSVRSVVDDLDDGCMGTAAAADAILGIFIVESWTHSNGEYLRVNDLTDREYRFLHTWARMNKSMYATNRNRMATDMVDMFPGITLMTAIYFTGE